MATSALPQEYALSSVSAASPPPSAAKSVPIEEYNRELDRLKALLNPLQGIPRADELFEQIDGLYRGLRAADPGSDELDRRKMEAFIDEKLRGIPGFDIKLGGAFEWTRGVVEKVRAQMEERGWDGSPRIPVKAFSNGTVRIREGEVDPILPTDSLALLIRELKDEITHSLFRRGLGKPDLGRFVHMATHVNQGTPLEKLKNLVRTEDALVAAEAFDSSSVDFDALVARAADRPIRPRADISVYSNLVREYGKDVLQGDARGVADKLGSAGFQLLPTPAYLAFKGGNAANLLKDMDQPMVQAGLAHALSLKPEVSGDWWKGFVDVLRDATAAYVDESSPIHMLRMAQVKKVVESSTKDSQREIFEGLSKSYHTAFAVDPFVRKLMTALFFVKEPETTYAFMDAMVGRATDEWWNSHYFTVPSEMQEAAIQQMMTPEFYAGMAELHGDPEFSGVAGPRQAVDATASFQKSIEDAIVQERGVLELTSVENMVGQLKKALSDHQKQAQATRQEFEKTLSGTPSPLSKLLLEKIKENPPVHMPTLQSAYRFAETLLGGGGPATWNETVRRAFGASGIGFNEWKDGGDIAAWVTGIYTNFIDLEVRKPIRVIPVFTLRKVKDNGRALFEKIPEFTEKFSDLEIPLENPITLTPYMWLKLEQGKGPGPYESYGKIMDADLTVLKTAEPLTDTVYASFGYSGSGKTWGLLGDKHDGGQWGGLVERIQAQFEPSTVEVREVRTTPEGNVQVFEKVGTEFDVAKHIDELKIRGSVMATPNNPESSRSFVGVTFRNKTGKSVTVVDMPGMEDFESMWAAVAAEGDDSACEVWEGTLQMSHYRELWSHKVYVSLVSGKFVITVPNDSTWYKDGQKQKTAVGFRNLELPSLSGVEIDVKTWQDGNITAKTLYPVGEEERINKEEKDTTYREMKIANINSPVTIQLEKGFSNLPIAIGEEKPVMEKGGISVTWAKAWGMNPVGEKMVEKGKNAPPMKYFLQRNSLSNMKRLLEAQSNFINRTLEQFKSLTRGMARMGSAGGEEYDFAASVLFRPPKGVRPKDWEMLENPPRKISPSGLKINLFTTMRPDRDIQKTAEFAKETMEEVTMRGGADAARLLANAWINSLKRTGRGRRLILRRKAKNNVDGTAA